MDYVMDHATTAYLAALARHGGEPTAIVGLLSQGGPANIVASYSRAHGLQVLAWDSAPRGLQSVPSSEALYYLLNVAKIGEVGTGNLTEAQFSALYDEGIAALGELVEAPERYTIEELPSTGPAHYLTRVMGARVAARSEGPVKGRPLFIRGQE